MQEKGFKEFLEGKISEVTDELQLNELKFLLEALLLAEQRGLDLSLLSKPEEPINKPFVIGKKIVIEPDRLVATVKGICHNLTRAELRFLLLMNQNRGRTVKKETLMLYIWGDDINRYDSLRSLVSGLRKKLGDTVGSLSIIVTHPHSGYRLLEDKYIDNE